MSKIKEISSACFPLMILRSKYIHREWHSGTVGEWLEGRESAVGILASESTPFTACDGYRLLRCEVDFTNYT